MKTSDVVVVFGALESLLHNLASRNADDDESTLEVSSNKKFQQLALDITRAILEDHVRYCFEVL